MQILSAFVGVLKFGSLTRRDYVVSVYNKEVLDLCSKLEDLGYISGFCIINTKYLKVFLKYYRNKPVLRNLSFVSRPSSRVYFKKRQLKGWGISNHFKSNNFMLLRTNKSSKLLTDIECMMLGTGGEPYLVVA